MSLLKRSLLGGALMLLFPLGAASAGERSCSSSEATSASRVSDGAGPEEPVICYAALCDTDMDCYNACPSATSAACVDNACQYSYSGGGGGGGGGGPLCNASFCDNDLQCSCNGVQGWCGTDWTCHY